MDLLKIKSFIQKSDTYFILNNYELFNIYDDFNIIIYYLNNYKFKIIIRKFNNINIGWKEEIKLKIYDFNDTNNYEYIYLGSCTKNYKIMNLKTKINLIKKENKNLKIPKNIFQTYINNNYHNDSHFNCVQSLIDFNPDFNYYFYNDIECRTFIKKNYNESILNAYDILYPSAFKADLFRYLIIYKYGGIYLDNKYLVRRSFNSIINIDDSNLYCQDTKKDLLFNSLLISEKENIYYKHIINHIVNNTNQNFYGKCPLHVTGPRLFYEHFKDQNIKLKHVVREPKKNYLNCTIEENDGNIFLNTFYDGYYFNKNHRNQLKNDYDFCFRNKLIYLKPFIHIKNYKFSILINKNINFNIELIDENENDIKIKLIFMILDINKKLNNNYKFIFINESNHKYVEFNLINVINKIFIIEI